MTVHALHVKLWKGLDRIRRSVRSTEGPDFPCVRVPVFDPRNGLPLRIACCKTDVNTWPQVRTVNSGDPVSTYQHQKNGFRPRVCFIAGILAEYAHTHA